MKKVREEDYFLKENIKNLLPKIDFSDTFSTINNFNTLEEITNLVFNTTPKWVAFLFTIRNVVVKIIGLKVDKPTDYNENFRVGGYVSFFKIYEILEHKIVLGADDTHLNFRAIILNDKSNDYNIKVITLVEFHNLFGKIYMRLIRPFHKIVVMRMVKNAWTKKIR